MFSVNLLGAEAVRRAVSSQALNAGAARVVKAAAQLAHRVAVEGAPGHVARSLSVDTRGLDASVSSPLPEALPIERGRRPGTFPPPDALLAWAQAHGFTGPPFVLARAIARRGIKGRFFMRAARQAVIRQWPQLTKEFEKGWP